MSQLALPLQLADHAVFASYLDTGNETLVATLLDIANGVEGHGCWLWGAPSSGKTHLLQAVCDTAGDRAVSEAYRTALEQAGGDRRAALRKAARTLGMKRAELYRYLAELGEDPG